MSARAASASMDTVMKRVMDFWFGVTTDRYFRDESKMKLWFAGGSETDEEIRTKFGSDVEAALAGKYDALIDGAHGVHGNLALVLLLDQFTRNIYRKTGAAYSGDVKALGVVTHTLETRMEGVKSELAIAQRSFLQVPLMHAENLGVQNKGVAMYEQFLKDLADEGDKAKNWVRPIEHQLKYAEQHRDMIARFGRFPYRNECLGRVNTPEEEEYLKHGDRFDQ